MLLCYPHAVIHMLFKGMPLKIFKKGGQSTQKKYEKKHNLFSLIYLKLISLIPSFVMNYLYNGKHKGLF